MKNYSDFLANQGEKKWQKYWEDNKIFEVNENPSTGVQGKEKFYGLIEFPYPSGAGLHVGHPRPFTAMDVICRKKRMEGKNVLFPIGFDAFGLPTENFAIKTGRPPAEVTAENIANFTRQLKMLGYSFAWDRVVDTTDPKYYKWTQWIFLQLFKHGLAYKKAMPINWCISCKIGLANEEVVDGKCERCGGPVEKRNKEQWMLEITKYADKLLQGLETVDYIPQAKIQQQNWIGRSEGVEVDFRIKNSDFRITVFTTRPDTLFGVTYMVVAPEHSAIQNLKSEISNFSEVEKYIESSRKKTDQERSDITKEKTGIELQGIKAINPANNEELPIFVADYVLGGYGTGAIMAVPAHDERDWEFAKTYNLPIKEVVQIAESRKQIVGECFVGDGISINSEFLNDLETSDAKEKMITWLEEKGIGKRKVQFKLRDWVFSRQRYWGEPIPLVFCKNCAERNKKQETRNKKVILIHGICGHAQENWFPWLKIELEQIGYEVFIPNLPNADYPDIQEWTDDLCKLPIDSDDEVIVIGHSLGAPAACKFVEQKNIKIKKLILVAPTGIQQEKDWFGLKAVGLDEKALECIHNFNSVEKDWGKIKSLMDESVIYMSDNDPFIPLEVRNDYQDLQAKIKDFSGKGHFNRKVGMLSFEAILSEFDYGKELNPGWIPLPESELPLELPKVAKYEPTDNGESPLAVMTDWVNTKCPVCGEEARRETDTMPNWAGSSWYFLRYCDPHNDKEFASMKKLNYWMGDGLALQSSDQSQNGGGVDWYNGGMEHTVLHLLYSRFWNEFLFDIGLVPTSEPYKKRTSHGMILASDGEKMSKSRGNVINPDEMVEKFGADAFRTYIMFMGPFDQAVAWDTNGVVGVRRFLEKVWNLGIRTTCPPMPKHGDGRRAKDTKLRNTKIETLLHQTIKKVSEDIEAMRFNTAISQLMILTNAMSDEKEVSITNYQLLITLLSPFAPHLCEELWHELDNKESISKSEWPEYDPELIIDDIITVVAQVNGKVRDEFEVPVDISEEEIKKLVLASGKVQKWLEGKEPKKVIYVKRRLVSIVI